MKTEIQKEAELAIQIELKKHNLLDRILILERFIKDQQEQIEFLKRKIKHT